MTKKKIRITTKPARKTDTVALDAFVETGTAKPSATPQTQPATKRLSVDIPAAIHKKARLKCLRLDVRMSKVIRELLEEWTDNKIT